MKISNIILALSMILSFHVGVRAQSKDELHLTKTFVDKQLEAAASQITFLAKATPDEKFPRTFSKGQQQFSGSSWWCSGFYPGTLLYLYEATGSINLLDFANQKLDHLAKEKDNTGTHDLGFMLYCSFGNALRITGDSARYKDVLVRGAGSLASRFSPVTQTIRSWDHKPWHYPVIIDNMMNLEFLLQMSKITGNSDLYDISVSHANTTLVNHFRKDYSSYHVVDYDQKTGDVLGKKTHQGAFDESAWSRGQGWALYGYTMMFRETGSKKYLRQARKIADYIFNQPNMPSDLVPYWDFDKDQIPKEDRMYENRNLRDVSAAALYASALVELSQYVTKKEAARYMQWAEKIITSLSQEPYRATLGENGGYILQHSVGALPLNSEVDVPLTYADYYYVEALVRYKRLLEGKPAVLETATR